MNFLYFNVFRLDIIKCLVGDCLLNEDNIKLQFGSELSVFIESKVQVVLTLNDPIEIGISVAM